jgi:electron transfer flavoprotein alpha/beta subunit
MPYKMSRKLREDLEFIAAKANDGDSHVVGDLLETILGYPVGDNPDDLPYQREIRADYEDAIRDPR